MTIASSTREEFEQDLEFLKAKLAEPKEQREKWLNGIVDKWIARRRVRTVVSKTKRPAKRK